MVDTIMDISEAETGMMTLARNQVNVSELVDQVLTRYGQSQKKSNCGIHNMAKELTIIAAATGCFRSWRFS